jgi:sugar lactone lactonase YvrE
MRRTRRFTVGVARGTAWRAGSLLAAAAISTGVFAGTHGPTQTGSGGKAPAVRNATWTTVFTSATGIEGLTSDNRSNLFVAERAAAGSPCPVWKINATTAAKTQVGVLPAPCSPSGIARGSDGRLFVTGGNAPVNDQVFVLTPGTATTQATVFATGVPQANGLALDRRGNLWISDGGNRQGIVYRVGPAGGAATEAFRVPPMANSIGVGRQNGGLQGTDPNTPAAQDIVANGVAFTRDGDLVVADTARGALWSVRLDSRGRVQSPVGCDETYTADTLCLDDVLVEHPALEGVDGIAIDSAGRIWSDANERNAVVVADTRNRVTEFFRSPVDAATGRRNAGPLEFPTSPIFLGTTFCTTSSDGNRRDNFPNTAGESAGTGKISCLDQRLDVPGLPLPVR